jgi:hypothetical protein
VTHPEQQLPEPYLSEAGQNRMLAEAVAEINAIEPPPAFVIHTGDMTTEDHTDWKNPATINVRAFKLMKSIMDKLKMPWYPVLGNHDQVWLEVNGGKGTHAQMKELLGYPPYYSFDYAHCHFVVMHSAPVPRDHGRIDGPQMDWISEDLKRNKDKLSLFFSHHLILPVDFAEPIAAINNADVLLGVAQPYPKARWFFSGHLHGNQTWQYGEFQQVLTTSICPWALSYDSVPGYRSVTVKGNSFSSKVKVLGGKWLPEVKMEDHQEFEPPFDSKKIGAQTAMMVELRARKAGTLKPFGSPRYWNLLSGNKPATASATNKDYAAAALTDSGYVTQRDHKVGRWESGELPEKKAWVEIDLQDTYLVNEVVVEWLVGCHAKKMTVEVSKDGKAYQVVSTATDRMHMGWNDERDRLVFDPVQARYVKVHFSKLIHPEDAPPSIGLWEVEVYGKGKQR